MVRRLGEATKQAARALESAIQRVPGWNNPLTTYAAVCGGISNSNWRVWPGGAERSYFVKMPGHGTELFIDRTAAAAASRLAATLGLGPAVHDWLAPDGIEIHDWLEGRRACTHADFAQPALQGIVARQFRRLHDAPSLALTKTIFDMIEEHVEQVRTLGGRLPRDWPALDVAWRGARDALLAAGLDLVPCFNDPMAGNFLRDDAGDVMLVDYEYASNNDRCYDLGIWFGEMFFDPATERAIVEAYWGSAPRAMLARIAVHKALADIKWGLWSMVQARVSQIDFDFGQYGAWKFLRARTLFDAPDWPAHLHYL